jgi:hypothetical protein
MVKLKRSFHKRWGNKIKKCSDGYKQNSLGKTDSGKCQLLSQIYIFFIRTFPTNCNTFVSYCLRNQWLLIIFMIRIFQLDSYKWGFIFGIAQS